MTISSTVTSQTMIGDGIVRDFPFTFRAWKGEVRVIITAPNGQGEQETDATASSVITLLREGGGAVKYPAAKTAPALPVGHKITIMRSMDFFQGLDLLPTARYDSGVIEDQFDRLVAQDQQLREELERAVKVPVAGGKKPQDLVDELFDAKSRAETAADRAAGSETAAAHSAGASVNAAGAAGLSAAAAAASRDVARQWAVNPEDAAVENNQYSAFHWAQKAQAAATGGALLSDELNGTRRAADMVGASEWALAQAHTLAQTAKGRADAANTAAGAAGTAAASAQATADEAMEKAGTAKSAALAAQATADEALATAEGGAGGGAIVQLFTESGSWVAPEDGYVELLLVNAGGAGGNAGNGGGGSGGNSGYVFSCFCGTFFQKGNTALVVVGASSGGTSSFNGVSFPGTVAGSGGAGGAGNNTGGYGGPGGNGLTSPMYGLTGTPGTGGPAGPGGGGGGAGGGAGFLLSNLGFPVRDPTAGSGSPGASQAANTAGTGGVGFGAGGGGGSSRKTSSGANGAGGAGAPGFVLVTFWPGKEV